MGRRLHSKNPLRYLEDNSGTELKYVGPKIKSSETDSMRKLQSEVDNSGVNYASNSTLKGIRYRSFKDRDSFGDKDIASSESSMERADEPIDFSLNDM